MFKFSQWVMLMHEGKCLVTTSANHGLNDFPGGRMDVEEEDVEKAMRREILEETGITNFRIIDQVGWGMWKNRTVMTITLAEVDSNQVTLSHEHTDYQWIGEDGIDEVKFNWQEAKVIMKKGFEVYKQYKQSV